MGSLADLGDDEIIDDAHSFKKKIKWLIIASSDKESIVLAIIAFIQSIELESMIAFGTARDIQDQMVFGGKIDILAKTPFGLFGRKEDELLEILEYGGSLKAITNEEQPKDGGTPEGTEPFLRVNSNGTLAVPGNDSRLEDEEYLIVVTKEPNRS